MLRFTSGGDLEAENLHIAGVAHGFLVDPAQQWGCGSTCCAAGCSLLLVVRVCPEAEGGQAPVAVVVEVERDLSLSLYSFLCNLCSFD